MPFDVSQVDTDPVVLALVRAKARIADPKNWCQGTGLNGHQRCATLALAFDDKGANSEHIKILHGAAWDLFQRGAVDVNDDLGHGAVMQVYDHAIDKARALSLHSPSGRGEG